MGSAKGSCVSRTVVWKCGARMSRLRLFLGGKVGRQNMGRQIMDGGNGKEEDCKVWYGMYVSEI